MTRTSEAFALLCAGQGIHFVGEGKLLAASCSDCRQVFETADRTVGWRLSTLIWEGPDEHLRPTAIAQPAVLTISVAHARHLQSLGLVPDAVAGHSLGQYTALVISGALELEDAIRLVSERGRLMQETVPDGKGAMVAVIGIERPQVYAICDTVSQFEGPVNVACHNAPLQTVISGDRIAVDAAARQCEINGATVVNLPVSVPFHCDLLRPMVLAFSRILHTTSIRDPLIPIIDNVTAKPLKSAVAIRKALIAQLTSAVLFEESVEYLARQGIRRFIQCGPGDALLSFTKRILRGAALQTFQKAVVEAAPVEPNVIAE
jgi:[acyl-carrier-protein] S-malonyltransferase